MLFRSTIWQLTLPHFLLGLGIGITDSALMPLLAILVESEGNRAAYGSVYAIAQTAVSLAYGLGPLLGGVLSETQGFPTVIRAVGCINLCYLPCLYFLQQRNHQPSEEHVSLPCGYGKVRNQNASTVECASKTHPA